MIKVTVLEAGQPDILDAWLEEQALEAEIDQAWGDWFEAMYDPDNPHGYLE